MLEKNDPMVKNEAKAYVDGSYINGVAGYGYVFFYEEEPPKGVYGRCADSVMWNVSGEIIAAQKAVEKALEYGCQKITIYHDYEGISKWVTGAWKAKKTETIAYRNLMKEYQEIIDIYFIHVKGHSGNKWNEKADELAKLGTSVYDEMVIKLEENLDSLNKKEGVTKASLRSVVEFQKITNPSFKDFLNLKVGGRDQYSMLKRADLEENASQLILDFIMDKVHDKSDYLPALRWVLRGLSIEDAIHKVNVDEEVRSTVKKE